MSLFEKAAAWMARQPGESTRIARDTRAFTLKHALFGALVLVLGLGYGSRLAGNLEHWDQFHLSHPLKADAWRVLPVSNSEAACPSVAHGASACPANPAKPELWSAASPRIVGTKRPLSYWLGTTIGAGELEAAARSLRTEFVVGRISSPYRIWIDGEYVRGGPGWEETDPIIVHVPLARLREARPLTISIRVYNALNSLSAPDRLNVDHDGEGFIAPRMEQHYRALLTFTDRVRPFALMLAYAVMALLFFFFWTPARVKQEYFYLALFAICGAIYQAKQVDLWAVRLDHQANIVLETILRFYMCAFGLFLGLSFARARQAFFRVGVPIALLLPFVAAPKVYFTTELYFFVHGLRTWMLPTSYSFGAAACLLQAWYLHRRRGTGSYLPVRIRRLCLFGAGMLALACFYFLEFRALLPDAVYRAYVFTFGFENFAFLLFFAVIALHEYGEQEERLAKTPVSQYHQRPILPERVSGALLVVDLKNSEELFRRGAKEGDAGKLVDTCISKMWAAVLANDGIIIQTEGDALRAFFDADVCGSPVAAALKASDEMLRALKSLEAGYGMALDFRGGIAVGDIRPIWQEMGANRYASWVEAGSANAFVESTRLMDLERQVEGAPQRTLVILSEEMAQGLESKASEYTWFKRDLPLKAKHGVLNRTAVYVPGVARPALRLVRAA